MQSLVLKINFKFTPEGRKTAFDGGWWPCVMALVSLRSIYIFRSRPQVRLVRTIGDNGHFCIHVTEKSSFQEILQILLDHHRVDFIKPAQRQRQQGSSLKL